MINIIRTQAVELTSIPALAFKQKLQAGGSGIKIFRLDVDATAVLTIDRRTGEGKPYGKYDAALFPPVSIEEAIELTRGLPYSARGKLRIVIQPDIKDVEDVEEIEVQKVDMVGSPEYLSIIDKYSDLKGKLNYQLLNKDFIQFASKSKVVAEMIGNGASVDELVLYILKDRTSFICKTRKPLSDVEVEGLLETLDEIDPRSAFKELKAHLKRLLGRSK